MQLKDLSFPSLAENVGFDEELFRSADKKGGQEFLRFWESPVYGVVLGRISKEEDDVRLAKVKADGIALVRRSSGGGTVLQGPGCLNYTLVLCKAKRTILNDLHVSYQWVLGKVIEALKSLGVESQFYPISDIGLPRNEKKFSGNAQHRGKTHILHHGTILYNFDLNLISKYLTLPKSMPVWRKGRSHADFLCNIPIQPTDFKSALAGRLKII